MTRSALLALLFPVILSACASSTLYEFIPVRGETVRFQPRNARLVSFFVNKYVRWYGEVDKFSAEFYTVDPIVEYFNKALLTRAGIALDGREDFRTIAKNLDLESPTLDDYTVGTRQVAYKRFVDYYRLFKHINEPDRRYLVVENQFVMGMHAGGSRTTHLTVFVYVLDAEGTVIVSRQYHRMRPLSEADYAVMVSYRKYNRETVQKRVMELFAENFMLLADGIAADLRTLLVR